VTSTTKAQSPKESKILHSVKDDEVDIGNKPSFTTCLGCAGLISIVTLRNEGSF